MHEELPCHDSTRDFGTLVFIVSEIGSGARPPSRLNAGKSLEMTIHATDTELGDYFNFDALALTLSIVSLKPNVRPLKKAGAITALRSGKVPKKPNR